MLRSWKIGSAFGIGIYVHWSFLALLCGIYSYTAWTAGRDLALFSLTLVLSVFACVVMHEFGHALMARRFGIETRDVTLLPIGGVARLERMSERPWEEICIAVAGPAVNVVIASVLLGVVILVVPDTLLRQEVRSPADMLRLLGFGECLLLGLLVSNVMLVVFNMIPAFPMDGGRVFRALLSGLVGQVRATECAAAISAILAIGMAYYGINEIIEHRPNLLPLVAMFVFFAGQQELAAVRFRAAQRLAGPAVVPVPAAQRVAFPPEPNFSGFTWDRHDRLWIEWREGQAVHACWVPSE